MVRLSKVRQFDEIRNSDKYFKQTYCGTNVEEKLEHLCTEYSNFLVAFPT